MEVPRYWRFEQQRYRLVGEICPNPDCNQPIFPPRDVCPHCNQITIKGASINNREAVNEKPQTAAQPATKEVVNTTSNSATIYIANRA
jgi:hypothetical protein